MHIPPEKRTFLAFDKSEFSPADVWLLGEIRHFVGGIKVGLESHTATGVTGHAVPVGIFVRREASRLGLNVFEDWKLPDTPNTVGRAAANLAKTGAWGITLKADAGPSSIKAAVQNRETSRIIGVTVLTSIGDDDGMCSRIFGRSSRYVVEDLVDMLVECKAQGVVCSPREAEAVRLKAPNLLIVTPGIRFPDSPPDDQKRTATPFEAIRCGADYIVVGRPITGAPHQIDAARRIVDDIARATENRAMV